MNPGRYHVGCGYLNRTFKETSHSGKDENCGKTSQIIKMMTEVDLDHDIDLVCKSLKKQKLKSKNKNPPK